MLAGHRCERSSCPGSRAAACLLLPSRAHQHLRECCWAIVSQLLKPSWARWTLRARCQPAHELWLRLGCAGWHRASLGCLFPAAPRSAQERRGLSSLPTATSPYPVPLSVAVSCRCWSLVRLTRAGSLSRRCRGSCSPRGCLVQSAALFPKGH